MRLHSPRVIGLAASGLVLAGWLLGSTLSPPVARTQEREPDRSPRARPPAPTIVPLRDLVAPTPRPAPPAPTRNPFTFATVVDSSLAEPPPVVPAGRAAILVTDDGAAVADAEWRLVGVAVDASGTVTAIVSGAGDVHLVRAGDPLPGGVTASEVEPAGVRLTRADGSSIALRLP